MAYPTIRIGSSWAGASDTLCSGAGPTNANGSAQLTGSSASVDATGLIVALDGAPDLSGVAIDGSHCLLVADGTAGARVRAAIVGADNAAKTVTVRDEGAATNPKLRVNASGLGWAIGGICASLNHGNTRKLFESNGSVGDAMGGWTIELQDGHAESFGTTIWWRRSGDSANGRITLRGASGALVRPKITWTGSTSGITFNMGGFNRHAFIDFDIERNISGSAGGYAFNATSGYDWFWGIKVTSIGTSNWQYGFVGPSSGSAVCLNCYAENCSTAGFYQFDCLFCTARNANCGIYIVNNSQVRFVYGNLLIGNAAQGIRIGNYAYNKLIAHNTIYASAGTPSGIDIDLNATGSNYNILIFNNLIVGQALGIKLDTGASPNSAVEMLAKGMLAFNNCIHNCTNQITAGYESLLVGTVTLDPQFTDPANGEFSVGANLKAAGFPTTPVGFSSTRSYVDIGAAQQQEPVGGGGGVSRARVVNA